MMLECRVEASWARVVLPGQVQWIVVGSSSDGVVVGQRLFF